MNEVTRIHLGRQPYTISVEAHKALRDYLAALEKKVGDKEVIDEVELRMSELLTERGVNGDKVILPADVDYLMEQLGDPADFSDDEEVAAAPKVEDKGNKRLYRDADNAMIAGVASGLASFSGLDVVLVRLIFVLLAIFGSGLGILLYILFWALVPSAKTASEKLQMQGKPVTLEALKDSVGRADISGAAQRVNNTILPAINKLFGIGIKLIGLSFILAGLGVLIGIAITKMYMLLHHGQLFQENIFPVGTREEWLLALGMILAVILAIFLVLTGIATFKRRWPIHGWITALLISLFVIGAVASAALAADAAPRIHDRYTATLHTTAVHDIKPFTKIVTSGDINIAYLASPNYAVSLHYSDSPDLSKIKIHVANDTLYIDSTALDNVDHCTMLCLFPRYNMTAQVYAPNIENFTTPPKAKIFQPAQPSLN